LDKKEKEVNEVTRGNANFVSFVDYIVGRKSDFTCQVFPYNQRKNDNNKKIDTFGIMTEELLRQCVRKRAGMSLI
jgi:hypothetical protein